MQVEHFINKFCYNLKLDSADYLQIGSTCYWLFRVVARLKDLNWKVKMTSGRNWFRQNLKSMLAAGEIVRKSVQSFKSLLAAEKVG